MVTDTGISKRQSISRLEGHREQAMIQDLLVPSLSFSPLLLFCPAISLWLSPADGESETESLAGSVT